MTGMMTERGAREGALSPSNPEINRRMSSNNRKGDEIEWND